jgi:hypothetical protein
MKQQPHAAYTVRSNGEMEIWTRIGAAFPNKKGGFTVLLDAVPASNRGRYRIVVLPPKAPAEAEAETSDKNEVDALFDEDENVE